ncbi:MAG: hypothetical protein LBJ73_00880 [Rickettsiales bacterium]|nr:hypothetical protein [Rickettsiales bacterium]
MSKVAKQLSIVICSLLIVNYSNAQSALEYDMADPMFLTKSGDIWSDSSLLFNSDVLRLAQKLSYGVGDKLSIAADIKYQQDFNGPEDGFSNIGVGGVYRLSDVGSKIVTDALFGINFGGAKRVREPDFADTIYQAGVRLGRQWSRLTLAGTIKTSWIFDENRGMAYIDVIPDVYIRLTDSWMTGFGFDIRKSTNPNFDRQWANFKLVRQYGRTQYMGHVDYEFENRNWQFGAKVDILF